MKDIERKIEKASELSYKRQCDPETTSYECFFHYTDELLYSAGFKEGIKSPESKEYWFSVFESQKSETEKRLDEYIKNNFDRKTNYTEEDMMNFAVSGSCEQPQDNNGDFVPLVWMIEELRRREGGCTMNELVAEAKRNFKGIEKIKKK